MSAERTGPVVRRAPASGRMLAVLLSYHVLVLGGGALLVIGWLRADPAWVAGGIVLFVIGVGVQLAVLAWTTRIIRRASLHPIEPGSPARPEPSNLAAPPTRVCLACGWQGAHRPTYCPQCGRPTIPAPAGRGPDNSPPS